MMYKDKNAKPTTL